MISSSVFIRKRQSLTWEEKQLLFIKYEALLENQESTVEQILNFLNASAIDHKIQLDKIHTIPYENKISKKEFDYLSDFYKNDIKKVEDMLGWECHDWKNAIS